MCDTSDFPGKRDVPGGPNLGCFRTNGPDLERRAIWMNLSCPGGDCPQHWHHQEDEEEAENEGSESEFDWLPRRR